MKKLFIVIVLLSTIAVSAAAQGTFRPKYRNIAYSSSTLNFVDLDDYSRSGTGGGFAIGRTFVLHPEPIANMLRLGIDATWIDMNYLGYKEKGVAAAGTLHNVDIAMGVGPAVHINPVSDLGVHLYFRYNPTASVLLGKTDDSVTAMAGYATFFTTGGAVSWKFISLGAEARFGKGTYASVSSDGMDEDDINVGLDGEDVKVSVGDLVSVAKQSLRSSGMRVYVSFRF